jgi:hypothetical protein
MGGVSYAVHEQQIAELKTEIERLRGWLKRNARFDAVRTNLGEWEEIMTYLAQSEPAR